MAPPTPPSFLTTEDLIRQIQRLGANDSRRAQLVERLRQLQGETEQIHRYRSPGGALFGGAARVVNDLTKMETERRTREDLGKTEEERTEARARIFRDVLEGKIQKPVQKPAPQPPGSFHIDDPIPQQQQMEPIPRSQLGALLKGSGDSQLSALGESFLTDEQRKLAVQLQIAEALRKKKDKAEDTASYRQWQEKQNELNRRNQLDAAAIGAGRTQRMEIEREERGDLRKREAEARSIEERAANAARALAELEKRIGEKGTFEALGPHNAELEGLITDYAIDMAKLRDPTSVARESEVEMEKKALFSPGLKTRNATALELLRNAQKKLQQRRSEAYKVRGLSAPDDGQQGGPSVDDVLKAFGE